MSCIGSASFRPQLKSTSETSRDVFHEVYPFEEGDYVILGPDSFATKDGDYIVWRGVVYNRVAPIGTIDPLEIT